MANVQDVKIPYEILVRFGKDGKPQGAHAQYIRRITIDGELVKEDIGNAEPLDLEGFPTSAIMSDTTRDALAEVQRLHAEILQVKEDAAAAAGEAAQTITGLEQSLATVTQDKMDQASRAATAEASLAEANGQIATLGQDLSNMAAKLADQKGQTLAANLRIKELERAAAETRGKEEA